MTGKIPLSKPCFDERETEAVRRVLASGWVVQGPEVEAFEGEIARLHEARHCIVVSSGTAALHICYLALGVGPGDAVFIPSFAWPSAANMAALTGARPVFVDVLPDTYNIHPRHLEQRIEECQERGWGKPRAIVPVHEFGLAADMDAVMAIAARHSLEVIEDAACALGATCGGRPVGTIGALGTFSFHPRKSITTGEGGAIVTHDSNLADRCRMWRNHGQSFANGKREFLAPGLNYRMTEIQAAIGRVQLAKFPTFLKERRQLADAYFRLLPPHGPIRLPLSSSEHTWQTFMVVLKKSDDRARIISEMRSEGLETGPGSVAGHLGLNFKVLEVPNDGALACSTELDQFGLALPLYAGMKVSQVEAVSAALVHHLTDK